MENIGSPSYLGEYKLNREVIIFDKTIGININRKHEKKYAQTESKLGVLPRLSAIPREQANGDSVEMKSQKSFHNLINKRGSLNSNDSRTILADRSRLQDMHVAKGGPVPNGSEIKDHFKSRKLVSKIAETGRKSAVLFKAISKEQIDGGLNSDKKSWKPQRSYY
ncbi:hypothetical protein AgCh_007257 [Apium graveolens]